MANKTRKVYVTREDLKSPARASKKIGEKIVDAIDRIISEAKEEMTKITGEKLAEIQEGRFANNGEYNGHERWADNTEATKHISGIGKSKKPLQNTGNLKNILTDPSSWDETIYTQRGRGNFKVTFSPPVDAKVKPYSYNENNYVQPNIFNKYTTEQGKYFHVARPYLDITDEDVDDVADALSDYIFNLLGKEL